MLEKNWEQKNPFSNGHKSNVICDVFLDRVKLCSPESTTTTTDAKKINRAVLQHPKTIKYSVTLMHTPQTITINQYHFFKK